MIKFDKLLAGVPMRSGRFKIIESKTRGYLFIGARATGGKEVERIVVELGACEFDARAKWDELGQEILDATKLKFTDMPVVH